MTKMCPAAWVGFNANPNGDVWPCCNVFHNSETKKCGNLLDKGSTIESFINSDPMKQMRVDFMNGKFPVMCRRCENVEMTGGSSYRHHIVDTVGNTESYLESLKSTADDGTIVHPVVSFWDIRYSALCNFKCRICSDVSSSSIHFEKHGTRKIPLIEQRPDLLDLLKDQIPNIRRIKVSGGEPILMREFWETLDIIIESESPDILLSFNTNASLTAYKSKSIFEQLQKLNQPTVTLSIDDIKHRAEYVRHGTVWKDVSKNVCDYLNGTFEFEKTWNVNIMPAVSIYNVLYIDELIRLYGDETQIILSTVFNPFHLSVNILPKAIKAQSVRKLEAIKTYKNVLNVDAVIRQLKTTPETVLELRKKCLNEIHELDAKRSEKFADVYPELSHYFYDDRFLTDASF